MGKLSVLFWHVLWNFLEDLMICCNSMFLGYLMSIWSDVTMMAHETYTEPCKDCLLKTIFKFRLTLVFDGKDSLALENPHSVKALHESCSTVFGKLPFCLELPISLCFFSRLHSSNLKCQFNISNLYGARLSTAKISIGVFGFLPHAFFSCWTFASKNW